MYLLLRSDQILFDCIHILIKSILNRYIEVPQTNYFHLCIEAILYAVVL